MSASKLTSSQKPKQEVFAGFDSLFDEEKTKNKKREQKTENINNNTKISRGLSSVGDLISRYKLEDKGGHITREFQDYGYRLAMELGDSRHKSLYMRLAKTVERGILEQALSFVKDAGAKNPGALFMWKVKQLRESSKFKVQSSK